MLQFTVSAVIPASPETVYNAWLNGKEHTAMTGEPATASTKKGGLFTAYGDYISGRNVKLVPYSAIVQAWRSTGFSAVDEDSVLEIRLEDRNGKTLLTLTHSHLPAHGKQYEQGWQDYYFKPMKAFFKKLNRADN